MSASLLNSIQHQIFTHSSKLINSPGFKLAETKVELEQAFRLVAHCYCEKGYISETDPKLRVKVQHALPETAIFIGTLGNRVVATSSVFPDTAIGLPADDIFQAELDQLRSQGRRITELGALASNLASETNPLQIPLHVLQVIRLAYLYGQDYLKADDLIITVNPKHQIFYQKALLFEVISDIKSYPAVNHAPAIAMRQNLLTIAARLAEVSQHKSRLSGLRHLFFQAEIVNLDFLKPDQHINHWNVDFLNYFFGQNLPILPDLTQIYSQNNVSLVSR